MRVVNLSPESTLASRYHHLLKTFWGWRDKQLPDGTVIWLLPDGQTYVTAPGRALLFPTLCAPTGDVPQIDSASTDQCADKTAMMPLRNSTRAQNRAHRIAAERSHNRQTRQMAEQVASDSAPPADPDEPPPF